MPTYESVLAAARSTLGEGGKPTRDWYRQHVIGDLDAWPQAWAWCAAWVCRIMSTAGMPHAASASCGAWINWAISRGEWHAGTDGIRPGDVVLLDWEPPANVGEQDHIGLVTAAGADLVQTVEGNAGDLVRECARANRFVVGYWRPAYDNTPTPAPVRPTVSLAKIIEAARLDGPRPQGGTTPGAAEPVKLVEFALAEEGLLAWAWAGDGSFGTKTITAYSAWQRRCGYTGRDADGIPGRDSLTRLGTAHGYQVIA
jgi:hypothetical protein